MADDPTTTDPLVTTVAITNLTKREVKADDGSVTLTGTATIEIASPELDPVTITVPFDGAVNEDECRMFAFGALNAWANDLADATIGPSQHP